ncbi:quinone oxidoreductase family protein [Streptomyces cinerochromogenes]|uniref:quinone oxidoreductase family protein n=1 Tax=Streptomyces cinerochromogenes TaxID=66422 RepID=UPI0016710D33|nr:zinc-binding dehydrogenase [Streptomyces cinerochromogenes]GGS90051.1 oxidoreductase [Streptomyces cinerochromogenes]
MRAVGFRVNGGIEVLEELDLPEPVPAPGQVAVRVAFAGVNFAEIQHRRGEFGTPDGPGGVDVPGLEAAGVVVALGAGVSGLEVGEPVAAYLPAFGGYAEVAAADTRFVRSLRTGAGEADPAEAAGLPCVYPTAFGLLKDAGRLREGEHVLIHSAAGGVGFAAAQLARELGAGRIYGTVGSVEKIPYADELGYDEVLLREGFAERLAEVTGGRGVDLVLDPIGGPIREQSLTALAPFGRVVAYGDLGRHEQWTASVWDLWKSNRTIAGFNIGDLARRAPERIGEYLAEALGLLATGRIRAGVTQTLPLAEAAKAHQLLETGTGRGKILLSLT